MGRDNLAPLKFGTSGIRGKDSELIDVQIYIATRGFLRHLLDLGEISMGSKVALAGDFRPSTGRIMKAVGLAIMDSGFKVDYVGKVPTPTLACHGFEKGIASIMVTGSHTPYGENGVKFNFPNREVLKSDEKGILDNVDFEKVRELAKDLNGSYFDDDGFLKGAELLDSKQLWVLFRLDKLLALASFEAEVNYINRYKKAFGNIFEGKRIVFHQQTCVGRELIPRIFRALGASVILDGKIDEKETFLAVDTEDMSEDILEEMVGFAKKYDTEITITTDGDSDRPAVVFYDKDSGKGGFLRGDKLNVLSALYLGVDYVSTPISANNKVVGVLKNNGIEVEHTKIGSPHVIRAMMDRDNASEGDIGLYAFEVNGGGLLGSVKNGLRPLPTRDAVLPMICAIAHAQNKNKSFYELIRDVFSGENESHSYAGLIENLSKDNFTPGCEGYTSEVGKGVVEKLSENKNVVLKYVRLIKGLAKVDITEINCLDGVRIYLSNGEVVHLRPSGNSSQFRIYSEAVSERRAKEIVDSAIAPNKGMLVKMVQDYLKGEI